MMFQTELVSNSRYIDKDKARAILLALTIFFKETRSVTLNIFEKKIRFKSFVKIELNYVFTINMFIKVENCMEK